MPRAPAKPDPRIETYVRTRDGKVFEIRAFRNTNWHVYAGGVLVHQGADPRFGEGFAGYRFASAKLQDEAFQGAVLWIETAVSA